jgi:hypothetical protein
MHSFRASSEVKMPTPQFMMGLLRICCPIFGLALFFRLDLLFDSYQFFAMCFLIVGMNTPLGGLVGYAKGFIGHYALMKNFPK